MNNKTKTRSLRVAIIAIALLLCLALTIGITSAWYQARRQAQGIVVFDQGIKFTITEVQDDTEDHRGPYQLQHYSNKVVDNSTGNKIVLDATAVPGEVFYVANPTINPASDTVPFALRSRLTYIFKDTNGQELSVDSLKARKALFQTLYDGNAAIDFGENWLYDITTDYFYYVNSEANGLRISNIAKLTGETAPFTVFANNLSGATKMQLNEDFGNVEAGGPVVDGNEIRSVEIVLDLEFLQYNTDSIKDVWGDSSIVVDENGVLTSATGFLVDEVVVPEVVDGKTVKQIGYGDVSAIIDAPSLVLPQTVTKIAAFSFPETSNDMTIRFDSSDTLSSSSSFKVSTYDGELVYDLSIGAGAFSGCPNLVIRIPSGKTYRIADNAFDDTAQILYGDSTTAISWAEVKRNASSYGITLFTPSTIPSGDNNPNKGNSGSTEIKYDTIEYISEDGLWGYIYEDTNINKSGKCIRIGKYYGSETDVVIPRTLGDDLNGKYQVLYIGSDWQSNDFVGTYTYQGGNGTYYDSVFNGQFNSITIPEGVLYADMAVGVSVKYDRHMHYCSRGSGYTKYGVGEVKSLRLPSTFKGFYGGMALNIAYFDVSGDNKELYSIDGILYSKDLKTLIKYPDLKSNDSFVVPSYVESISDYAFYNAKSMQYLTINNNVKRIQYTALHYLGHSLNTLTYNANATMYGMNGAWYGGSEGESENFLSFYSYNEPKNVVIGDEVVGMVGLSFIKEGRTESLYIGKNITDLLILDNSTITKMPNVDMQVTISNENSAIAKDDNLIYNRTNGKLYYIYNQPEGEYIVPLYIAEIPDHAFATNDKCTRLVIGDHVKSVGSLQFLYGAGSRSTVPGASALKEVVLPENLTIMPKLTGRVNLQVINIPNKVTQLEESTFFGCALTKIELPENLITIGKYAFEGCSNLTFINLPEGLQTIDAYAFAGCSSLTSIIIPSTVTVIGDYAFQNCTNLSEVKYAVSYDLNGVEADPVERTLINATLNANGGLDGKITSEITLPAAPTNATKTFLGWFDGSETKAAGSTCIPIRRRIVAVWEGVPPKYIITLDAKGGEGTYTIETEANKTFTLPDFTGFKQEGYFPSGWWIGRNLYKPGDTITPTSDMTIYVSYTRSNFYASGSIGRQNYTPEYILSKENPQYGDSLQITFEVPSKFKVSNIRYTLDGGQNYITVEHSYPVCGETITVTIDKVTYYNISFTFEVADEYVEFIFDYDKQGLEPITVGGWLNDTSFKFIAPSSIVKDGYSIKQWKKRDGSYPPSIGCGHQFTPYSNSDLSQGTYYAVWEEARIINGNATVNAGSEEDLTLQDEWMIVYSDLVKKMQSGELSKEEQQALQQQIMSSDVYARYMASMNVYYSVSVSGLIKSGDVYTQCDKELLKTVAYQVTGTDGAYAVDVYEVLITYTDENDASTYEYLYLKCTKGVDATSRNTIYFRNESTNSKAGQYRNMVIYVCLSGKSFTVDPNGGDGESKTLTAYATREAMLPYTLKCEGKVLVGFSKNPNAKQGDDGVITAQTYKPTEDNETLYAIWRNKKKFILKNPNNLDLSVKPVYEYTDDYDNQCVDLPTNCPFEIPENYTFKGWVANIGDTNYYSGTCSGPLDLPGEEITLYAYFEENAHIILNSNDENNTSVKIYAESAYSSIYLGDYLTVFGINGNRVIIGWSRTAGATEESGRDYNSDDYYSDGYSASDVVTLYAVWKEMTYYVTLVNTATGEEINVYNEDYRNDSWVYLNLANYYNLFKCEGKTLIGWSKSEDGSTFDYDAKSGNTWFSSSTNGTKLYAIFSE